MSLMTRRKKLAFTAGAAAIALLVVGLGAAGAIAASSLLSPSEESKAIIDDAAEQLGVEPDALSTALKQALKNRVDEAVEAGRLTEEQAEELKKRIDFDENPLLFGRGGHRGPGFGHHGHFEILGTAASFLGMTEAKLRDALQDSTLAEIAKEQGKTVPGLVAVLVASRENSIEEAVGDGRITEQQASELKSRLTEHMEALVNGERRAMRDGRQPGLWQGSWSPRGPPPLRGPSA